MSELRLSVVIAGGRVHTSDGEYPVWGQSSEMIKGKTKSGVVRASIEAVVSEEDAIDEARFEVRERCRSLAEHDQAFVEDA